MVLSELVQSSTSAAPQSVRFVDSDEHDTRDMLRSRSFSGFSKVANNAFSAVWVLFKF